MNEKQVKIVVGYLITQSINLESEIKQYYENLLTFINQVDKVYIYLTKEVDISKFITYLTKYPYVEIAKCIDYGDAEIYKALIDKAISDNADYVTLLKPDMYYENESFLELKKYIMQSDVSRISILTPMPLFGCELHERKAEEYRAVKGCAAYGALLNLHIYKETRGIKTEYYQTTFDYDYCLQTRLLGYDVMLAQNQVLRKQNYRIITKKLGFITLSTFERDLLDIYYETRNRYYLWEKFKNLDPEYVKIDQKLFKSERKEMIFCDKASLYKKDIMEQARKDAVRGIMGKQTKDVE
jgi:rhamnosyltransferase